MHTVGCFNLTSYKHARVLLLQNKLTTLTIIVRFYPSIFTHILYPKHLKGIHNRKFDVCKIYFIRLDHVRTLVSYAKY